MQLPANEKKQGGSDVAILKKEKENSVMLSFENQSMTSQVFIVPDPINEF